MSSWGNNDNSANAPLWAVNSAIAPDNPTHAAPTSANVALLYGNTTPDVYTTNETIGLFARNASEIVASSNVYAHTGWVIETAGSGGRAGRVQREVLVALSNVIGDAINGDYPEPGSGTWKSAATALSGITYANIGTPYNPGGNVATVSSSAAGLLRKKYDGNFTATSSSLPATWNYSFFETADFIKEIADEYVSWGQQTDGENLGESLFSVEWKGYVQVPTTQNYNFYAESDDHIAMWIGTDATATPANGTRLLGSNNKQMPSNAGTAGVYGANSVTLTAGQWYPVRIWFSEHTGGCKAQVYAQGADGTKLNGEDLTWAHNSTTGGYNP